MPARGNEKPRVENRVYDLQRRWATPVPRVADLAQLNDHLRACCLREREHTIRGRDGTIGARLAHDQAAAVPLPATSFLPVVYQEARVDKYQSVRYDNACYSVPRPWAFRAVTVRASVDWVEVLAAHRVVARHPRCYKPDYQSLDPRHYLSTLACRPAAVDIAPLFTHWQLPPIFAQLREALARRDGPSRSHRAFVQVLRLLEDHPLPEVAAVLTQWLQRHPEQVDVGAIRLAVERRCLSDTATLGSWPQVEVPVPDLRRFEQLLPQGEPTHA
jgi:hypothetical protein